MSAVVLLAIVLQTTTPTPPPGGAGVVAPPPSTATRATAVRATGPVVIDGRDDDEVWRIAPPITQFREFQPKEDGDPRFATEAKAAYDDRYFYVFIRAFDPHPDSILKLLARRDVRAATDQLKIMVDSYHDRRSGFEFAVNPAGVKRDYAMYNDSQEDDAWDAVWDVGTQIDSLGWSAEFRIPLSQLRYVPGATNTFGFAVWRDIQRYSERVSWPVYRGSQAGISSQLGELTGLDGLPSPRRPEIAPYVVTKNVSVPSGGTFDRSQKITGGADLKYGITPSLTLDATVNPDFGQVEADPAVLNLTAFETFFQERRPFFVQGAGIFRFDVNCSAVNDCSTGEGLFYSRRIGRAPQVRYGDPNSPSATTIYGAAKLTGRLPGGQTVGVLDAVTGRETATLDRTMEPTTNYAAVRAQQDFRNGESGIGVMVTAVNRHLDQWTEGSLRRSAYAGAFDFRHRFLGRRYQISGSFDLSRVAGTPPAIAATQNDPVHYYQRPGVGVSYDPTRTSLAGDAEELKFGKVGGGITRFETSYQRRSQGFELNDLGFLRQADQQSWNTWFAFQSRHPSSFYQTAFWNFNWWQYWTAAGTAVERAANTNVHAQLNNRWWVHGGVTAGQLGTTFCDRNCSRGGPPVRVDPYVSAWGEVDGDGRPAFVPYVWFNYWRSDGGRSESFNGNIQVTYRVASQVNTSLTLRATHNVNDVQPIRDAAGTHYLFAHLNQKEVSLTGRVDYTLSTVLTFQLYAQPFISKGAFSNVRELADPNAAAFDDRYRPYAAAPGGFNFKQFNSTAVLRWEYRPGSTLFVVWTQGREDGVGTEGSRSMGGDFRDLFHLHPNNTFLVKASYWINW
jgi:hypothetical protein